MYKLTLLFCLIILLSSCGIYRQNVVNVPLLEHAGQAQLSAHTSFTAYDVQAAYAATNHIAVIANYSNPGTIKTTYSTFNYSIDKHDFAEAGIGLYKTSPGKKNALKTREIFFVAGSGSTSHFVTGGDTSTAHHSFFTDFRKVNYNRFMIQVDLGRTFKRLQYAVSPRLFLINYYMIADNASTIFHDIPNTFLYGDVSFTIRYNIFRSLKICGQMNATLPLAKVYPYYDFSPFNFSLGILLNLNLIKAPE